jgi:signal peptidase I
MQSLSDFFQIGDNSLSYTVFIILLAVIILLIISIFSIPTRNFLKKIKILEPEESPVSMLSWMIAIILIVKLVQTFVIQPFVVDGGSMLPNLHTGEVLLIDKVAYKSSGLRRGDIIVFKFEKEGSPYSGKHFVKRVIGLAGETVEYKGQTYQAGADELIVMGDNREESYDSRSWGPLKISEVDGKVSARIFPLTSAELHPAPAFSDGENVITNTN